MKTGMRLPIEVTSKKKPTPPRGAVRATVRGRFSSLLYRLSMGFDLAAKRHQLSTQVAANWPKEVEAQAPVLSTPGNRAGMKPVFPPIATSVRVAAFAWVTKKADGQVRYSL